MGASKYILCFHQFSILYPASIMYMHQSQSPNSSHPTPFLPCIHTFVPYICGVQICLWYVICYWFFHITTWRINMDIYFFLSDFTHDNFWGPSIIFTNDPISFLLLWSNNLLAYAPHLFCSFFIDDIQVAHAPGYHKQVIAGEHWGAWPVWIYFPVWCATAVVGPGHRIYLQF